jgi:hypothetical protein
LNFHGDVNFTYRVSDGSTNDDGTVTLTVNPMNDAPVANGDSYSVATSGTVNVTAPGVLGNDTDVDGDGLMAVLVTTTINGVLTLNSDGSFTYTHNGGGSTSDSFTYKANDGAADSNTATVTIAIGSATTMHVGDLDGSKSSQGSTWTATVGITVHDSAHNAVAGAAVSGTWSNGATGSASCTTDTNGRCTILKSGIAKRTSSVTFTVGDLTLSSLNYDSAGNHDPDADSGGVFITVTKP